MPYTVFWQVYKYLITVIRKSEKHFTHWFLNADTVVLLKYYNVFVRLSIRKSRAKKSFIELLSSKLSNL